MKGHLQFGGLLLALALALPALAQRGTAPPASLLTGGTHMSPASPSILTMHSGFDRGARFNSGAGFSGQHNGGQHNGVPMRSFVPRREHHRERQVAPLYGGYYYPYYGYDYGYTSPVYEEDNSSVPCGGTFDNCQGYAESGGAPPSEYYYRPRAGANSVLDGSRYGEHYTDGRENQPAPSPSQGVVTTNGNENNDTTTLLIFKDGIQREVTNYAIMGKYVYVFSGDRRKIPLSEIDIEATVKANEERGTEFKIPSSSNPS
jgi:hypothetical protein